VSTPGFMQWKADLGQQNIGLASAWRKAAIRVDWRRIVDTAMLQRSVLWKKERKNLGRMPSWHQQLPSHDHNHLQCGSS